MALMKLLRLPTEQELEIHGIDFENFYQDFIASSVAPFVAKVNLEKNGVDMDGYSIKNSDWFEVVEE